jgi:hypothetical protein
MLSGLLCAQYGPRSNPVLRITAAVIALPTASRIFLLKLFGLPVAPKSKAAQAARIDAHRTAHHPALAVSPQAGGNVERRRRRSWWSQSWRTRGSRRRRARGSRRKPRRRHQGLCQVVPAFLPAKQVEALLAVPCVEPRKLLRVRNHLVPPSLPSRRPPLTEGGAGRNCVHGIVAQCTVRPAGPRE